MTAAPATAAAASLPLSADLPPRRSASEETDKPAASTEVDETDEELLMAEAEADEDDEAERGQENDCGGEADDELEEQLDLRLPKLRRTAETLAGSPSPLQQQPQQQQPQQELPHQHKHLLPPPPMPPHSRPPQPLPPTSLPLPPRDFLAQRDFLLAQQEFFAHHHQQMLAREAAVAAASAPFLHAGRPGGLPLPLGLGRPPVPMSLSAAQMPPPPPQSSSSALMPPTSRLLGRSDCDEEHRGGTPESLTPPPSEKGGGLGLGDDNSPDDSDAGHHWTFEEQFKQLYELSEEPKRKQFLDDLFAFMQRRGTPVNRIPIMAKQVLDLYELFRLVVSKGGLVEVINKKLWREITKGLNLPSSITSAAFTLRTQYMKYLYPYECEKLKLSSPGELQAAIDGNRREGRRPNYPAFECGPNPGGLPPLLTYHSSMVTGKAISDRDFACLTPPVLRATPGDERHHHQNLSDASPKDLSSAAVAATVAAAVAAKSFNGDSANGSGGGSLKRSSSGNDTAGTAPFLPGGAADHQPPPAKRPTVNGGNGGSAADNRSPLPQLPAGVGSGSGGGGVSVQFPFPAGLPPFPGLPMPSNGGGIRIAGHHGGHLGLPDSSVVISMEINGLMYHGVLFAQPKRH